MSSDPRLIDYFIRNAKEYFVLAQDYVTLSHVFDSPDYWTYLDFFFPFILIGMWVVSGEIDFMSLTSLFRSFSLWYDYFRYRTLKSEIHEWSQIIDAVGGPFISTNDPIYQSYVYADGMQRIFSDVTRGTRFVPSLPPLIIRR